MKAKMADVHSFWCCNFVMCLMLMTLPIHRVAAGYSTNGCDVSTPNLKHCYGRGSSDCADAMGNLLNGNETYAFIQTASLNYLTFVGVAKYDWQAGVHANLLFLGTVGFAMHIGPQLFFGKLVGCPTYQLVNNTNSVVDGFNFLTGADVTTALNLFDEPYGLQCNVLPVSRLLNLPYESTNLNAFLNIDYSGLRSFIAEQNGSEDLKSIAKKNIVTADVIVNQIPLTSQITVQQANSTISADCVVTSGGGDVNQVLAIAFGNTNVITSTLLTANRICALAVALAQSLSTRSTNLLDTIKVVTVTGSQVFVYNVGYSPNFLSSDFIDALLAVCKNT